VKFTSNTGGDTFTGSPCTLSGSGGVASCQVTYTPGMVGNGVHTLTASYGGDKLHSGSKGKTTVTVTAG
jgi:hypothetical protein